MRWKFSPLHRWLPLALRTAMLACRLRSVQPLSTRLAAFSKREKLCTGGSGSLPPIGDVHTGMSLH